MSEKMDAGNILYQETIAIEPEEDADRLTTRLSLKASEVLPQMVEDGLSGGIGPGIPQDDSMATYTPMITKEMGRIDWSAGSTEIARQVRALILWPTAYTFLEEKMLKVFSASVISENETAGPDPGTILSIFAGGLKVATGGGSLLVREVQLENRKRMDAGSFARGYREIVGRQLA
jgi:methionyl-tRNA formyltransferase